MSLILSIESSTTVCSAAIHRSGQLLSQRLIETPNSAASKLAVLIQEAAAQARVTMEELEGVAVSSGPGSYTGLRIAVATAKGLCYAMQLPLIAVSSLELMAAQVRSEHPDAQWWCPMIDARRMEVYTTIFDREGNQVEPMQATIIDDTSFSSFLEQGIVSFFGNGSSKCQNVINHPHARWIANVIPTADWLGKLAWKSFMAGQFEDVAEYEPLYLKDFVAKKPKSFF